MIVNDNSPSICLEYIYVWQDRPHLISPESVGTAKIDPGKPFYLNIVE